MALSEFPPWLPLGGPSPSRTPTCLALFVPLAQSLQASQLVRAWTFLYLIAAIIQIEVLIILCHQEYNRVDIRISHIG